MSNSQYPECDTVTYAGGGDLITIMGTVSTLQPGHPGQARYFTEIFVSNQASIQSIQSCGGIRPGLSHQPLSLTLGPWELFGFHSKLFLRSDEKSVTPLEIHC